MEKNFKELATLASKKEKLTQYKRAGLLWLKAGLLSRNPDNIGWAANRAKFCQRMSDKQKAEK
ncbi:ANR family transcriptional regulator [Salmonella enterica subsp. enterica serovar Agama]|uniref:ANR family transcriptional regulator n=1 Tax=Salmonella enterica TaxID=28901 RepID=UPI0012E4DA86|nr:ANR family transcriptional regulator [Salmonella enterica subsp. enterica serovar Pomona]ECB7912787.1 ANR family transcriptional regulator [Salmonella enterica subsp. enterica serovar Minnesota]EHJ9882104.1 ANR family transcriptional regulator [Salmonella enterica subsp. enterica serovar Adelaide]EHL6684818.1 ANR family transcriptional regulator [Salmonella enterica]EHJ9903502.1 ANR family transcriptional regulator [Salmonella enterica subsp. enterica serovar Adelaide]